LLVVGVLAGCGSDPLSGASPATLALGSDQSAGWMRLVLGLG
jgi:hypothetical protein